MTVSFLLLLSWFGIGTLSSNPVQPRSSFSPTTKPFSTFKLPNTSSLAMYASPKTLNAMPMRSDTAPLALTAKQMLSRAVPNTTPTFRPLLTQFYNPRIRPYLL